MYYFFKTFALPAGFLIASIIGAGMFALPFVFQQSGLVPAILYLAFFGIIAALTHLIYADIVLRTRETRHQFPGYIKQYLGKRVGNFSAVLVFITLLFTLAAYLVLSISFLRIVLPTLSPWIAMSLFWFCATVTIFIAVRSMAFFNALTAAVTLLAIGAIFLYWGSSVPFTADSFPIIRTSALLLPFGPVLFSFLGFSAIPPLVAYVRKEAVPLDRMKRAIAVGSLIPALFYLLFIIAVLGMSSTVSPDSVSGLVAITPFPILAILSILGVISLWDSYSAVGRDIDKLLVYEWGVSPSLSLAIVAGAPLLLYVIGFQDFIAIISAVGGILFSIWGILLVLAWRKAVRVSIPSVKFSQIYISDHTYSVIHDIHPFVIDILLVVFAGGILYEVFHLLGL